MRHEIDIRIGGLLRFSTLDYPGLMSSVIFCQGCPNRCKYCHNQSLIPNRGEYEIQFNDILDFLQGRIGLLDAVVFSGGEPLIQSGLVDAIVCIRNLGYKIGLHTSGVSALLLKSVIDYVDWVGFDVKAPKKKYKLVAGSDISDEVYKCIKLLQHMNKLHEIRTTYDSSIMNEDDLINISNELYEVGERSWIIQKCIRHNNNKRIEMDIPSSNVIEAINKLIQVTIR